MIWLIIMSALFVIPFWKLLPDYGIASAWALVAILPVGALALLFIMAFGARREGGGP